MTAITLHPIQRRDLLLALVVILIGALVRLYQIDVADFGYDQANNTTLAQTMLATGQLPAFSTIASFQGAPPHPPLLVYLVALPLALGGGALAATVLIACLNIGAIGLLWYIGHRYFAPFVGLLAGLLLAINPWAIYYSRSIWQPNITVPFILLAFVIGGLALFEGKRWAQIAFLPALALMTQTHYSALLTLPAFLWLVWAGRRQIDWRRTAVGLLIAVMLLVPYSLGVMHWFGSRTSDRTEEQLGQLFFAKLNILPLRYFLWFTSGTGLESVVDSISGNLPDLTVWWIALIPFALGVTVVLRRYRGLGIAALWMILVPIVVTVTAEARLFPHYYNFMLPALALVTAVGIVWMSAKAPRPWTRTALTLAVFALCGSQFAWDVGLLQAMDQGVIYTGQPPIRDLLRVRDAALINRDVMIFYPDPVMSGDVNLHPLIGAETECMREFAIAEGGLLLRPRGEFTAIFAPFTYLYTFMVDPQHLPQESIYRRGTLRTITLPGTVIPGIDIPGSPHINVTLPNPDITYEIYDVPPLPPLDPVPMTPVEAGSFDNGVKITGYAIDGKRVYMRWTLPPSTRTDYQYFIHFLDANGQQIAQHDTSFYPGKYWCEGDELITWFDTDVPTNATAARIGMYRLTPGGAVIGSDIVDATGRQPWLSIALPPQ